MDDLRDAIAILAMAGRFPGAGSVEELWRNLREGVESISFFSPEELAAAGVNPATARDPRYVPAKAVFDRVELFDAAFFGFTPREAGSTDPQHRLLLECAWEAMEQAGYGQEKQPGPVGVFVGSGISNYFAGLPRGFETTFGGSGDFLATRISYKLNLEGPSLTVQTACSTSLVAVHLAAKSLLDGECDMALAGGVSIRLPQRAGYLYEEEGILSLDGHCRTFDARATGTVGGNGAAVVLLKRLEDALADGDPVRAVLRASAINNDGSAKVGFTAPSVEGQARVIGEALALARVSAETIGYVEAHGTATPLGDPIEVAALTQAFRAHTERQAFCALGSVKTNLGHLDAAAGVTGLIKTVLALEHGLLPPSLHFESPNPRLALAESPFYVNTRPTPWVPAEGMPRRAGVSSFGMGGTNAHVILEEAPATSPGAEREPPRGGHLLVLSARTEAALVETTARLAGHVATYPALDLADVAYTLAVGRRAFEHRRIAVCADRADAAAALADPWRLATRGRPPDDPPVVFLFPGQGSQHAGMGRDLYAAEELFRTEVDRCCDLLLGSLGCDLRDVLFPAPGGEEEASRRLAETVLAQPALFVLEYSLARLWMSWGVRPAALLGHSVGDYAAACLAGVFSLADALALVAERGRLIQALPHGGMLAVPLPESEVQELLAPGLALAAVNAPDRCVVAGADEAVGSLAAELGRRGVLCRRLRTSHAFHSEMMEPILRPFAARVRAARPRAPELPVVSGRTGTWLTATEAADPEYWAGQLRHPVRFADGLLHLAEEPERVYLEVGPGRALTSLLKQTLGGAAPETVALASLPHPGEEISDRAFLLGTLGRLWLSGVRIDWPACHAGQECRRVALPTYPFERKPFWIDPGPASSPPAAIALGERTDGSAGEREEPGEVDPAGEVIARQLALLSRQLEFLQGELP